MATQTLTRAVQCGFQGCGHVVRRPGDCGDRSCPRNAGSELARHASLADNTGLMAQAFNDPFGDSEQAAPAGRPAATGRLTTAERMSDLITDGYTDDDGDRRAVVDAAEMLEKRMRHVPTAALLDAAWADTPLGAALADGPAGPVSGVWSRSPWGSWTRHPAGSDPTGSAEPGSTFYDPVDSRDLQRLARQLRTDACHRMAQLWAVSPIDHPQTRRMQQIAGDAMRRDPKGFTVEPGLTGRDRVYGEFLSAQYRATQDWLAERDVEWVTLHRGESATDTGYRRRPLASWTTEEWVADFHATTSVGLSGSAGTDRVVTAEIPARDILALPVTGMGTMTEYEAVVLSRPRPDRSATVGLAAVGAHR